MNRIFATNQKSDKKIWTQEEIQFIDSLLLSNNEKAIFSKKYFKCSKEEKIEIVDQRKIVLQKREWEDHEDSVIISYIHKQIKLQQLRAILILRDNKSIMERRDYLL